MKISRQDARKIVLKATGLDGVKNRDTLSIIKNLGYVQIDTISVVERAHHHTLWSRNDSYLPEQLNQLTKARYVFEYWSHAASYLPMDHYRFCLPRMEEYRAGKKHWFATEKKLLKYVLDKIKAEGPLKSKDFESTKKTSGWYDWKPTKQALEQLFMAGELMISHREGFQKVYDLPENVLPSKINTKIPTEEEFHDFFIHQRMNSLGIASLDQIAYLRNLHKKNTVNKYLSHWLERKEVEMVKLEGSDRHYFVFSKYLESENIKPTFYILSPFDNLVIQRERLREFFNFDYLIECYVPESKRKYGYFCLPLLMGDKFIGRIDLKADRFQKNLIIKRFFKEKNIALTNVQLKKLTAEITKFAIFNGCSVQKVIKL